MKKNLFLLCLVALAMFSCGNKTQEEETVEQSVMQTRALGATGIQVAEIGVGCGAFADMDTAQAREFLTLAMDSGVNYIDIYDANPKVRGNIGYALQGRRDQMIIQGHIGSYWDGEQYKRTIDVEEAKKGFEDLLTLLGTDHIDVGMIHIADTPEEWEAIVNSPFLDYVKQLKAEGKIKHVGLSSHNTKVALEAVKTGLVEVLMFAVNPAFDMISSDLSPWDEHAFDTLMPAIDPVRMELYDYCTQNNIAIVAMKAFGSGGGRLLNAEKTPLKSVLTPSQCLSYALSKPCVATVVCGAKNIEELKSDLYYNRATEEEKDYSSVLK